MANKKAEIKSRDRTLYLQEELFEEFSKIAKDNGKSASAIFNNYMKRVVEDYKNRMQKTFEQKGE